ncbi:uncharacterized protein [Primulina huaijiensis]|uniref:uncharacterized protein n=1 Tax=Primulina huaijiensis TaxID=1492673 RepID=UPI003CC769D9
MEVKRRKKGRPSKTPHLSPPPKPIINDSAAAHNRRSTRHNPNLSNFDESGEEDERKEKKVKLVVRLPQSGDNIGRKNQRDSTECDSGSGSGSGHCSDSDPESEEPEGNGKKRRINAVDGGSTVAVSDQEKKFVKATDNPNGWPLECVSATPLPDKKLLVFILQRLQKKDTRGAFSEPVDPDELPDYHEIIKQPMDFGTVNKKLDSGAYKTLEELEEDVLLICSNAMTYNPPDSIYHRQARSIQDLAMRDFENLRHEGDDGRPQPKVVRRGRPPGKNPKKPVETSPIDRVGPEISSGATLASGEGKATGSNPYNLRKAPPSYTFRSMDPFVSTLRSRNGENCYELSTDWNGEFPASILRADMKYGKKNFTMDENRRDTYGQFHPLSYGNEPHVLSSSIGDAKRLVPVGLHDPLAYARSLARFAVNLGPVAWKIASEKIESVLPDGVQYGPGWVGEAPSHPSPFSSENWRPSNNTAGGSRKPATPSTSDLNSAFASKGIAEAVRKLNSQNEPSVHGDVSSWRMQFPAQQKPDHHPQRNGFTGVLGYHLSAAGVSFPPQMVETVPVNEEDKLPESWGTLPAEYPKERGIIPVSHAETESWNSGKPSWPEMPMQQRHNLSVPPDLNLRVPAVSSSSSLQIGSPKQQPDLALQL